MLAWRRRLGLYSAAFVRSKWQCQLLIAAAAKSWCAEASFFQEVASAHLTRATLGMCFCRRRRIYVGFRVQVSALGQGTAATPVDSIAMVL